ncbi:MAG: hypothetical protein ACYTFZ_01750 [Planctomycetota bacterium]|jgi:hypothetical protein
MTQLLVHADDKEAGEFGPVYAVCMVRGRIFVRPLRENWADVARRLEEKLNGPGALPAAPFDLPSLPDDPVPHVAQVPAGLRID